MKFVLRLDDVGWTEKPEKELPLKKPDGGLALAQRFCKAMGGAPWLAGVIPDALDKDGVAWLRSRPKGLTVAMHGVTHRRVDGVDSEFRGYSRPRCTVELESGKIKLGVKTRHFIPPFNALEPELREALPVSGFSVVWGHYSQDPQPPRQEGSITFVPSYYPLYSATLVTMGAGPAPLVDTIPYLLGRPGALVITLHLPWEAAKCDGADFEGVRELMGILGGNVISPEEYLGLSK